MNISVCKETVTIAKECLLSGKSFKPFDQLFKPSEKVTAKHELYEQFVTHTNCLIPKIFIYIVMDELFGQCNGKDEDGNLGYYLHFNNF